MIGAPLLGLAGFLLLSEPVERLARPRRGWSAPAPGVVALRLALLSGLYLFWLALFARTGLAFAAALATLVALVWVSNVKFRLLGEPLVFADFQLAAQVLRHPQLYYVEYLQGAWLLLGVLGLAAGLGLWLYLETGTAWLAWPGSLLLLAWPAALLLAAFLPATRRRLLALGTRLGFQAEPIRETRRLGLVATLALQFITWLAQGPATRTHCSGRRPRRPASPGETLPHVLIVQNESFVDPRRHLGEAQGLPVFERLCGEALAHGPLRVPAAGAYTMRTEFAVLTGIGEAKLGFDRFNPYLRADRVPVATLAHLLAGRGYRTVFMHPHDIRFFRRDRVMPALGFERLLGEEAFDGIARRGPYVSDAALAERVLAELAPGGGPRFVFAVTMENHGPWRPGRLPDGPTDPQGLYLAHLQGADAMLARLDAGAAALDRPLLLCFYGDHPPVLPVCGPAATVADRPAPHDDRARHEELAQSDYLLTLLGNGAANPPGDGAVEPRPAAALPRRILAALAHARRHIAV